jgi:hypothetical protein
MSQIDIHLKVNKGWKCSSVVEHVLSVHEIPSPQKWFNMPPHFVLEEDRNDPQRYR